ncbi:unnamed protein product [Ilex paraguariensis]|uniref:Uncharacterized protein n=1 Tax=Ilex paraguariensis TaxID=185542 RepID=A0ABC8SY57_9AQUA
MTFAVAPSSLAGVLEQGNKLVELVDPTLGSDYNHKEAETILELAMMCINQSSSLRPIMSQVVKVLEGNMDIRTLKDELGYAKVLPSLSQPSQSGSTSQEGTSVPTLSHSVSKETGEQSGISQQATSRPLDDGNVEK